MNTTTIAMLRRINKRHARIERRYVMMNWVSAHRGELSIVGILAVALAAVSIINVI